jgi:protein gp37
MPTKIEWATETWNPITGCSPVSEGCANCYAKRMSARLSGRYGYPADDPFRPTIHPDKLDHPMRWKKSRMIFVCSMSDLFVDTGPDGSWPFIDHVLRTCNDCPQHVFLLLTKRIEAAWYYFNSPVYQGDYKRSRLLGKNIWLGVTAENQERYDERWTIAASIPAAVHFVSGEPLLDPIDTTTHERKPDWFILGGESGPGARPMHSDWARSLRDQCVASGVPFFFKQWGEWLPFDQAAPSQIIQCKKSRVCIAGDGQSNDVDHWLFCGKTNSGRLLDGREWNEYPAVNGGRRTISAHR